jgi:hypothetical protein
MLSQEKRTGALEAIESPPNPNQSDIAPLWLNNGRFQSSGDWPQGIRLGGADVRVVLPYAAPFSDFRRIRFRRRRPIFPAIMSI